MFIEASILVIGVWQARQGGATPHLGNAARRKPHGARGFPHFQPLAAAPAYWHERHFLRNLGNSPGY